MKIISDTVHGVMDYATVILFALAPSILGLAEVATAICYALAVVHLAMTLLTDMPLGVVKAIPIRLHALVELVVGPVLIAGALAFPAWAGDGRAFFVIVGAAIFMIWLLSRYGRISKLD
jgi:hypothetical protein